MKRSKLITLLAAALMLLSLLTGCRKANDTGSAQLNAVRDLECSHPVSITGMCPVSGANAAVCWTDAAGEKTTVQLVDTDDDSVSGKAELDGEWVIVQQDFCDKRIALCDREHNRWSFLSSNLADLGTVQTENSDGFFSYDAKNYYFLSDDVLWRQELESGQISRVELDYDLRFLNIVAFDGAGSRMLVQFYLSPYSSKCGTAMFDPATGKFSMLQSERYQAVFSGTDVCLMSFDETAMGYSVLCGGDEGSFNFADAGIFLDGSSEIYGINGSPLLMGTSSEISILYSVGQRIESCRLSDCGIAGAIYTACFLPDEERLLCAVYAGGTFKLYAVDIAELEFEYIADSAPTASPLTVNETLAQAYAEENDGGTVAETLSQARQIADGLGEKYGVQILISSQCAGAASQCDHQITLTDTMDAAEELGSINAALRSLDRSLALYPDGFFAQFKDSAGDGGVRILLVEEIKSDFSVSGCTYERGRWQNVALDVRMAYDLDGIVCHELWHATENHILSCDYSQFTVDSWAKFNPQDFSYYEDYVQDPADGRRWTYYSGGSEGVYFVDSYSKTFASEDRARIMEFFMTRDDDAQELIKSPAIKKKLQHMSSAVRSVFDTSGWGELRWERLL